ncbi:host cell division inhibitor Icd-like protein [Escherichia coli]|nr:host cell division inhibitor Icd-like protein [Escherichia coli]
MSDFVLDKTKATAEGRQWESYILERIANNARFAAGGQCVSFAPMTLCLTEGHYGEYAGLLVGYSCSLTSPCRDVFQVCDPIFVRLYSLRNFSRINAQGANLFDSCSYAIFLRCLFRAGDGVLVDSLLVMALPCKTMHRSPSHHGAGDGYSCFLALRRWRRLISPFAAVTKKPAVLSPGSLSCSISSITSCGILTVVICDFAFFAPVAISGSPKNWCMSVYAKKMIKKGLKCISPVSKLKSKGEIHLKEQRPAVLATHAGRLTKPLNEVTIMAGTQHTQTHPKFIYTFLAVHRDCMADGKNTVHVAADTLVDACKMLNDMGYISATWKGREENTLFIQKCENNFIWRFIALSTAQPRVIHIEATSEQEARQQSPDGCVMVFTARIRQEVEHV